mmetsp:Transcript_1829/g.3560  ORF Transcript_1829/g.3560 Transcript_1829/m.3560 type:complete len:634 (-) Transcript_1829:670-2571(-)
MVGGKWLLQLGVFALTLATAQAQESVKVYTSPSQSTVEYTPLGDKQFRFRVRNAETSLESTYIGVGLSNEWQMRGLHSVVFYLHNQNIHVNRYTHTGYGLPSPLYAEALAQTHQDLKDVVSERVDNYFQVSFTLTLGENSDNFNFNEGSINVGVVLGSHSTGVMHRHYTSYMEQYAFNSPKTPAPTSTPPTSSSPTSSPPTPSSPTPSSPTHSPPTSSPPTPSSPTPSSPTHSPPTTSPPPTMAPTRSPTSTPATPGVLPLKDGGSFSWSLAESPSSLRRLTNATRVNCTLTWKGERGWISVGVSEAGTMANSNVVIAQNSDNTFPSVGEYKLLGYGVTGSGVMSATHPDDELISDAVLTAKDGKMTLTFTASHIAGKSLDLSGSTKLIFARGNSMGNSFHQTKQSGELKWNLDGSLGGENDFTPIDGSSHSRRNAFIAHASLMLSAFLFFFPFGALVSVFRKQVGDNGTNATWFMLHQAFQILGVAMGIAAFALAVSQTPSGNHFVTTHSKLGLALFVVMLLQPLLAYFLRKGKTRPFWLFSHILFAMFLVLGGVSNCFIAINDIGDAYLGTSNNDKISIAVYVGTGVVGLSLLGITWSQASRQPCRSNGGSDNAKYQEDTAYESTTAATLT